MQKALKALASLRFTVALLALAMVLIFVGTIAQTRLGVWQAVDQFFRAPIAWVDVSLFNPRADRDHAPASNGPRIPIPGGLTITLLMIVNLVSAHALRFKLTARRVGVIALHAGLIVLLAGELVTGFFAEEGLMSIDEGESSSFIEDIRDVELAIIDPSDPETDRVVTVPGSVLADAQRRGETIDDERLPADIRVRQWMPNARLFEAVGETPATRGAGLDIRPVGQPRGAGASGSNADTPAAYVSLVRGDEEFGTWLVSASLANPQAVEIGDARYGLALRYQRTCLPFGVHLHDFSHDTFTGTSIAKNFSSDVRLIDPTRDTDRDVRIWMNNPLRYAGKTFYQASYKPDGSGTVLQVVNNPGWLMPYLACALVGGGMAIHFGQSLTGFLRRRVKRGVASGNGALAGRPRRLWLWPVAGCGVLLAISGVLNGPEAQGELDIGGFGEIPVSAGGRIKPMDTAARSMLMIAGGRQAIEADERDVPATEYLLDLVARPDRAAELPIIRVDHPGVLDLVERTPDEGGRLSLAAIEPHWGAITEQAHRASSVDSPRRDDFQRAVLEVHRRVNTVLAHAQMREPYAIPPLGPEGSWRPFREAFVADHHEDQPHPAVAHFTAMMSAASGGDPGGFNKAVDSYTALLDRSMPGVMRRARLEVLFHRASLFTGATAVYVLAFLGACGSFLLRSRGRDGPWADRFRAGSFALLASAVLVHTVAIAIRVYLQDRPPVTNLYSSAIFVGWAAALAGLVMERLYPLGVAILGSAVIGCGTLVVAHNLGSDGDTMQMMQAVLDSNFWLATHVITITLGYSAAFLAGALGSIYLLARLCTSSITPQRERTLGRMTYGVVCFAMLLSFVGTVLGGIWADQSWGRFWGWDPKENGAALVVLMNAIILHARWGGFARVRGIAVLAVAGNIVTAWSWFGTNMLGVGLHAYGFMDSASFWLIAFVASQLALICAGLLLPTRIQHEKPITGLVEHPQPVSFDWKSR